MTEQMLYVERICAKRTSTEFKIETTNVIQKFTYGALIIVASRRCAVARRGSPRTSTVALATEPIGWPSSRWSTVVTTGSSEDCLCIATSTSSRGSVGGRRWSVGGGWTAGRRGEHVLLGCWVTYWGLGVSILYSQGDQQYTARDLRKRVDWVTLHKVLNVV